MWVRLPCLPLLQLDGETEIIPRFERGVPGSIPGRAAGLPLVIGHLLGSSALWIFGSLELFHGVRGVAAAACLAVNQEVWVRLPSDTPLIYTSVLLGESAASKTASRGSTPRARADWPTWLD